jgi:hypothetical protein
MVKIICTMMSQLSLIKSGWFQLEEKWPVFTKLSVVNKMKKRKQPVKGSHKWILLKKAGMLRTVFISEILKIMKYNNSHHVISDE